MRSRILGSMTTHQWTILTSPKSWPKPFRQGSSAEALLVCGTGIGMAIVANKVPGVRAACCHDPYSAERARKSNDAQVITMGAQVVAPALAMSLLDIWLQSEFAGGRSTPKVDKIKALDQRYRRV